MTENAIAKEIVDAAFRIHRLIVKCQPGTLNPGRPRHRAALRLRFSPISVATAHREIRHPAPFRHFPEGRFRSATMDC